MADIALARTNTAKKMKTSSNLRLGAAKGRGRLQLAAKRLFELQTTISTTDLVKWCLWPPNERHANWRNWAARTALSTIGAVRAGRATTRGNRLSGVSLPLPLPL